MSALWVTRGWPLRLAALVAAVVLGFYVVPAAAGALHPGVLVAALAALAGPALVLWLVSRKPGRRW